MFDKSIKDLSENNQKERKYIRKVKKILRI